MSQWVSFAELREQLRFEAVLRHFKVEIHIKGEQHQGFCPLPSHQGKKRTPSFSANLERGIFQCFGCGAKGNLIDFAVHMQGGNPANPKDVRQAALMLHKELLLPSAAPSAKPVAEARTQPPPPKTGAVLINHPLDFALKKLDAEHPYLAGRGFNQKTIAHFGLGYCARGWLGDRFVIPLHNHGAELIGYAGRLIADVCIDEEHPKYRFPGTRERKGVTYEFRKTLFLYNGHRIKGPVQDLIVVEGFPAVWWLWQHGFASVVGLMGASCSDEQSLLIQSLVAPSGCVWVFSDGNEAGERCAASIFTHIAPHRAVRRAKLTEGRQPTDCSPIELARLLPV